MPLVWLAVAQQGAYYSKREREREREREGERERERVAFLVCALIIYTMHNKFSNFLCFASLCAHLCAISNNFNCNDNEQDLRQMKLQIYRRHPLKRHLGRSRIAGGVSKQNSNPL